MRFTEGRPIWPCRACRSPNATRPKTKQCVLRMAGPYGLAVTAGHSTQHEQKQNNVCSFLLQELVLNQFNIHAILFQMREIRIASAICLGIKINRSLHNQSICPLESPLEMARTRQNSKRSTGGRATRARWASSLPVKAQASSPRPKPVHKGPDKSANNDVSSLPH